MLALIEIPASRWLVCNPVRALFLRNRIFCLPLAGAPACFPADPKGQIKNRHFLPAFFPGKTGTVTSMIKITTKLWISGGSSGVGAFAPFAAAFSSHGRARRHNEPLFPAGTFFSRMTPGKRQALLTRRQR